MLTCMIVSNGTTCWWCFIHNFWWIGVESLNDPIGMERGTNKAQGGTSWRWTSLMIHQKGFLADVRPERNSMNKNITYDFLLVLYSLGNTLHIPSVTASSEAFFLTRFDVGGFPFELLKEVFYIFWRRWCLHKVLYVYTAIVDGSEIPNNHLLDGARTLWIHGIFTIYLPYQLVCQFVSIKSKVLLQY